ncbi:hypothetical protein, partial [Lacrimispora sp.]|uniref:hypothetical protein n=1 Tax=Lacrimispora sp. TaxID=2719234 RepID=UPI00345F3D24
LSLKKISKNSLTIYSLSPRILLKAFLLSPLLDLHKGNYASEPCLLFSEPKRRNPAKRAKSIKNAL